MTTQPIPTPTQIQPFKPHGTSMAVEQGADRTIFYAVLGSIQRGSDAERKASFRVYVWMEKIDGSLTLIQIEAPPNNAPSFAVVDGGLKLYGVRHEGGEVYTAIECDIPGFAPPATVGQTLGVAAQRIQKDGDPLNTAVRTAIAAPLQQVGE